MRSHPRLILASTQTPTGKKYEKTIQLPKGELENPAKLEDFYSKYYECTDSYWPKEKQENVLEIVNNLEEIGSINHLMDVIENE